MNEKTNTTARPMLARASELTVSEWGAEWLARRRLEGHRSMPTETSRWKYVQASWLGDMILGDVSSLDARRWLSEFVASGLSMHTIRDSLNQIRQTFEGARELGRVKTNVFNFVRLPRWRPNQTVRVDDAWTVLEQHEQATLLHVVPERDKALVAFAMGTGLRQGEQWSVRRQNVHTDGNPHVVVAFGGTDDRPTKSGTPRTVPLFGIALVAMKHHNTLLDARGAGPEDYVWPAPRGGARDKKPPRGWRDWLKLAGISRRVRWHDLRHTCAASLVSGWWGRAWTLEEVRELLGHSSITITERYAHFSKNVLRRAAEETIAAQAGQPHLGAP